MKRMLLCAALVGAFAASATVVNTKKADNTDVSVTVNYRTFFNTNVTFTAAVPAQTGYPAAVGTPLFWIDANDTVGWTIAEATGEISKIVNKGSSDRYLTAVHNEIMAETNYKPNPTQTALWYGKLGSVKGPLLKSAEEGIKGPYIDFGLPASCRMLFFSPWKMDEDCEPSNRLHSVGTVIGVYKSNLGGGQLLGGRRWLRWSGYGYDQAGTNLFESIVCSQGGGKTDTVWQRFRRQKAQSSFWTGDWEVVAINPTAANCYTEGVGCGDPTALDAFKSASGQAIAELLVYDRVLTDDEVCKVAVYLEKKWLGDPEQKGTDGHAEVSWVRFNGTQNGASTEAGLSPYYGIDVPVSVPEGQTLTIGKLDGGRAKKDYPHYIVKTGAGTLKIGEGREFGGVIDVRAGTLEISHRATAATLPVPAPYHFDFSDSSTVTTDGDDFVLSVTNKGSADCVLAQETAENRPKYVRNLPRAGLAAIDCGDRGDHYWGFKGYLAYSPVPKLSALFVVIDRRVYAGAPIANNKFRPPENWHYYNTGWMTDAYSRFFNAENRAFAEAWVNGLPIDVVTEYVEAPGFSVVALCNQLDTVSYLGRGDHANQGGSRFCEVIGYDRPLSDREILDVQAYLMKKWLGRSAPGYADTTGIADLQRVKLEDGATIHVPDGDAAYVDELSAEAYSTVYKTGGGTLYVGTGSDVGTALVVQGGRVQTKTGAPVASSSALAAGASVNLDASRADLIVTHPVQNGTNYIHVWQDAEGRISAYYNGGGIAYNTPFMCAEDVQNGLPLVNFGEYANGWSNTKGCQIGFSKNILNARAIYLVVGTDGAGAQILGVNNMSKIDESLVGRNIDLCANGSTKLFGGGCDAVQYGQLYVDGVLYTNGNGVAENPVKYVQPAGVNLIELHTAAGVKFDCLGNGWEGYYHGGFRLGQIVVYERALTERERIATRNHLLKKWFGKTDEELAPLPEEPSAVVPKIREITVPAETVKTIDEDVVAGALKGSGEAVVDGAALTLDDISAFSGTLTVASGSVTVTKPVMKTEPRLLTSDRIFHFDASDASSITRGNPDGKFETITEWRSQLDDGLVAVPGYQRPYDATPTTIYNPLLREKDLNGLDVVDIRWTKWNDKHSHLLFRKNGVAVGYDGIKACFWVIGSQEGGGDLLGGCPTNINVSPLPYYIQYTQKPHVNTMLNAYANGSSHPANHAAWLVNGVAVNPRQHILSGGYDLVSMNMAADYAGAINGVWGFAFDGYYYRQVDDQGHCGQQRLGEVIAYDRTLTDEEVAGVQAYLQKKWGFAQPSMTNAVTAVVASGATLTVEDGQYFDRLGGEGAVNGDVRAKGFVAEAGQDPLAIDGTLEIAAAPCFDVSGVPQNFTGGLTIVLAEATAYAGTENLANAVFTGISDGVRASAKIRDGKLVIKITNCGMILLFR